MNNKFWTEAEIAILVNLTSQGSSLRKNMHLLPGRTLNAALYKSKNLKPDEISIARRLQLLMQDGKERTARQIADSLGMTARAVKMYLRDAIAPGTYQWAHVARIKSDYKTVVYAFGPGENVDYESEQFDDVPDADLDARFRAPARWWPAADAVVVAAMQAMVSCGRAAA
jgi:hypothetical protein